MSRRKSFIPTVPYDRAAIMRDAWKRFNHWKGKPDGFTFAQCLSTAWKAEKMRRAGTHVWHHRDAGLEPRRAA